LPPTSNCHFELHFALLLFTHTYFDTNSASGEAECVCSPGYESFGGAGGACSDIDECATFSHDCSLDADCINQVGTFGCVCHEGFVGNGVDCNGEFISLNGEQMLQFGAGMYISYFRGSVLFESWLL
jgi:hypothetical protein